MITRDQLSDLIGAEVVDDSGAAIGTVGAVYLDEGERPGVGHGADRPDR